LTRLVAFGDNVVDIYRGIGCMFPGGNAVNVAVAARRCGIETAYLGAVGTDDVGALVRSALAAEKVETARLRVLEGPSAFCIVELDDGNRRFVEGHLGVSRFRLDATDLEYLSRFDCVHTGDNSGTETQLNEVAAVARLSFDFSDKPPAYYEPLLDKVWFACFSGAHLETEDSEALARRILGAGPEVVLVTEGARGALLATVDETVRVPAASIRPIDTLGAGDAVIGGVLAGLLSHDGLEATLTSAVALASNTCLHYGAFGYGRAVVP